MNRKAGKSQDRSVAETARKALEQAEAGHRDGRESLDQAHRESPPSAEAAEQAEADGPAERGLDR